MAWAVTEAGALARMISPHRAMCRSALAASTGAGRVITKRTMPTAPRTPDLWQERVIIRCPGRRCAGRVHDRGWWRADAPGMLRGAARRTEGGDGGGGGRGSCLGERWNRWRLNF